MKERTILGNNEYVEVARLTSSRFYQVLVSQCKRIRIHDNRTIASSFYEMFF